MSDPLSNTSYDVLVIGGGPGGCTAATLLSDQGKKVLLLEKSSFPRYHIGESLLSGTTALLRRIGVEEKMERAGFVKKYGVEWVWGKTRSPWTVYFKDALANPYDYGYQVERADFDKMLLDNAAEHGVVVREMCEVTTPVLADDRVIGVNCNDKRTSGSFEVRAPWTIDASGQSGLITKQLRTQSWDPVLKNMAIWSYWRGARRRGGLDSGNTFLPTFGEGWWWFIPLRDDITSIGMVVDRSNYESLRIANLKTVYRNAISRTPELAERLTHAQMTKEPVQMRDWSYRYDRFHGSGYIAVGDAACFIDPLFSTGVHLAMLSGFLASLCINTMLDRPQHPEDNVLDFYQRQYSKEYERLKEQVYFLYSGHARTKDDYFWKARSLFAQPGIVPEKAFISLIAGSYEHRSWYRRYLNQLSVPRHLQEVVSSVFTGDTIGTSGMPMDSPIRPTGDWEIIDDFALAERYLVPSRTIRTREGYEQPLTDILGTLLQLADGRASALSIIQSLKSQTGCSEEAARKALSEAATFGVITSASMERQRAGSQPVPAA